MPICALVFVLLMGEFSSSGHEPVGTLTSAGSPLALAGLLYGGSALALLTARAVRGMLALLTLLGGIAAPICLVSGLALLLAGSASLLLNLEAVFTMGIAVLIGRDHLSGNGTEHYWGIGHRGRHRFRNDPSWRSWCSWRLAV
jgi:drug/metabolite transporter (DMT)-like permease